LNSQLFHFRAPRVAGIEIAGVHQCPRLEKSFFKKKKKTGLEELNFHRQINPESKSQFLYKNLPKGIMD
jgi:hypothetical protein